MSSNNPKLLNLLERIKQKILKIEGKDYENNNDVKITENNQLKQEVTTENKNLKTSSSTEKHLDDDRNYLDEIKNLLKKEEQLKNNNSLQDNQNITEESENLNHLSQNNDLNEPILNDQEQNKTYFQQDAKQDDSQDFLIQQQDQKELPKDFDLEKVYKNDYQDSLSQDINKQDLESDNQKNHQDSQVIKSSDVFDSLFNNNNDNTFAFKKDFQQQEDEEDLIFHYTESKNETQQNKSEQSYQNEVNQSQKEQAFVVAENNFTDNEILKLKTEPHYENFDDEFLDDSDVNISEDQEDIESDQELNFDQNLQNEKLNLNAIDLIENPINDNIIENEDIELENLNINDTFKEQKEERKNTEELLSFSKNIQENQNLSQKNDSLLITDLNQQNESINIIEDNSIINNLNTSDESLNCENILQNNSRNHDYLTQNITSEIMNNNQSIINEQTQNEVKQALEKLHQTQQAINNANNIISNENLVKLITDMLEPKLTEWLNNNLGSMVEKIVQEEINKLFVNKK